MIEAATRDILRRRFDVCRARAILGAKAEERE